MSGGVFHTGGVEEKKERWKLMRYHYNKKATLLIAASLATTLFFVGCSSSASTEQQQEGNDSPVTKQTPQPKGPSTIQIGHPVTLDGYVFTVNSVKTIRSLPPSWDGGPTYTPKQGTAWVIFDVSCKNETGKAQPISSLMLVFRDASGQQYYDTILPSGKQHVFSGTVQDGQSIHGEMAYEVVSGSYTLLIQPTLLTTGQYVWWKVEVK